MNTFDIWECNERPHGVIVMLVVVLLLVVRETVMVSVDYGGSNVDDGGGEHGGDGGDNAGDDGDGRGDGGGCEHGSSRGSNVGDDDDGELAGGGGNVHRVIHISLSVCATHECSVFWLISIVMNLCGRTVLLFTIR